MGKRKIDLPELGELLRAGKKSKEIAERFGVTVRALQKTAKEFGEGSTRHVISHQAEDLARQDIDARKQLLQIYPGLCLSKRWK